MAYASVAWQPDDDVTYQKLQQMSSNDEWLKNNQTFVQYVDGDSAIYGSVLPPNNRMLMKTGFNIGATDGAGAFQINFATPFPNSLVSLMVDLTDIEGQWNAFRTGVEFLKAEVASTAVNLAGFRAQIYEPATGNSYLNTGNFGVTWVAFGW